MHKAVEHFLNYQYGYHQIDWVCLGAVLFVLIGGLWVPSAVRLAMSMKGMGRKN